MTTTRLQPKATSAPSAAGQGLKLTAPRPTLLRAGAVMAHFICFLSPLVQCSLCFPQYQEDLALPVHPASVKLPRCLAAECIVKHHLVKTDKNLTLGFCFLPPSFLTLNWPFGLIKHLYHGGWVVFPVVLPEASK